MKEENIIWGVAATLGVVFIVFIWEFARDAYFAVAVWAQEEQQAKMRLPRMIQGAAD